jgi:hypothetical protein
MADLTVRRSSFAMAFLKAGSKARIPLAGFKSLTTST